MQENIIKISEMLGGRYDPLYFSPSFLHLKKRLKFVQSPYIGSLIETWSRGDGPRDGFYTEDSINGVPFIRINNLKEHSVVLDDIKYINREIHEKRLKRTQTKSGDLIFAISGTKDNLGTVSIVPNNIKEANLNSALVKLNLDETRVVKKFFCYFFDLSIAQIQIDFIGKGAAQNNLNNQEISEIMIPLPSMDIQNEIVSTMDNAYRQKREKEEQAKNLLASIDDYVLQALGITLPEYKKEKDFKVKISSLLGGRYDPEYNQPYFQALQNALSNIKNDTLDNLLKTYKKGVEVGSSAYVSEGVPFVRVSDFNSMGLEFSNYMKYISQEEADNKKEYMPKSGEILYSKDGSIGNSLLLEEDLNAVVSGAIVRLIPNNEKINSHYLAIILALDAYKKVADRESIGAIIKHLNIEKLLSFKIPLPSLSVQEEIADNVQDMIKQAKHLQTEAKTGLEEAKAEVEKILLGE